MNEFETAPPPSDRPSAPADLPRSEHASQPPVIDHDERAHVPPSAPPPQAAPLPPARPAKRGGSNLLTVFLFLVTSGGLYYVWAYPQPAPQPAEMGDAVAALKHQVQTQGEQSAQSATQVQTLAQQVQTLSDRVDKLEKTVAATATQAAATPAATPDLGDLPKRLDDLTARVETLASRPAAPAPAAETPPAPAPAPDTGALQQAAQQAGQQAGQQAAQQAVTDLTQKLEQALATANAKLDQVATQEKSTEDALAGRMDKLEQGAGQVESTADRAARLGRVQAAEVALQAGNKLGAIPGAPPALTRFANTAPPTEAALREAFPAVAAHAREVSRPDVSRETFLQRTLAHLEQSVTVRQGDDVLVGDPAAGVLADAEAKVQNADLTGAVKVLAQLHGPAAQAVQPWVDQAQSLLAAREALAGMAARP